VRASLAASGVPKRHESIANRRLSEFPLLGPERHGGNAKVDHLVIRADNLQTNHLASVSSMLPLELVRRHSRHCLNLIPTSVLEYAASEQVISLEFVFDADALQLLSAGEPKHTCAHGEPGATWRAATARGNKRSPRAAGLKHESLIAGPGSSCERGEE
jgi:hypothetical protein